MANDFKALIGIAYDIKQAQTELDRQIKSLQKSSKLALNIELSDKDSKKVIQDSSKMWSNYRKEAVSAITAPNSELKKMSQYYKQQEADIQSKIALERKMFLAEQEGYKTNENLKIQAEKKVQTEIQKTNNLASGKTVLSNQISTYLKENSKLSTDFRNKLILIKKEVDNVGTASGLKNLRNQFREISTESKSLGQTGANTFEKFTHNLGEFTTFLSAGTLIMSGVNSIRAMVSTVVELDKAFVDLQMATGGTNEETKKLLSTYIDMGQQLGATGTEVAAAASDYLRQGKSIEETNKLITDSIVLSKIGNIDAASSTTFLTTAMKGYKVAVDDVIGVVDKLSAVDMASATSAGGLAEAMAKTATNADLAGVSMDKLLGYIAVVGETTGEAMSSVGQSFSTIFSRMANIKLSRLVDPTSGEDLSNVETSLRNVGIALRDDNKTFRNFGDVLDDIAGKWNGFDEVNQRAIASSVAGKLIA